MIGAYDKNIYLYDQEQEFGIDDAYDDLTDARCNSTTFIDSFFFPIDPPIQANPKRSLYDPEPWTHL